MRGQRHTPAAFTHGKDRLPIVQEAGWTPGPVWTGAENLASTGIRSPDRPARSQSLYRLSYPAHSSSERSREIFEKSIRNKMRMEVQRMVGQNILAGEG